MAHARITVNGKIEMDENLGNWQARPPEYLKRLVDKTTRPEPHIKAVGIVLADSLLTGHDVSIDVTTDGDEHGTWSMQVSQSLAIALPGPDTTT